MFLLLSGTGSPDARAATIDMEGKSEPGGVADDWHGSVHLFGDAILFTGHAHFWSATHPRVGEDRPDNGTDFLLNDAPDGIIVAAVSGAFSLTQFDASEWGVEIRRGQEIVVTGTYADGGSIVATFVSDAEFGFETFTLPAGFENLESVNIKNANGAMAWDNIRINEEPTTPIIPILSGVELSGGELRFRFESTPGRRDWKVLGTIDLQDFSEDVTGRSTIVETGSGNYEVAVDVTGMGQRYYFRVEW